jgi:hypothetical protein
VGHAVAAGAEKEAQIGAGVGLPDGVDMEPFRATAVAATAAPGFHGMAFLSFMAVPGVGVWAALEISHFGTRNSDHPHDDVSGKIIRLALNLNHDQRARALTIESSGAVRTVADATTRNRG